MAGIKKLLFVDTNIWLDFYRRGETALSLLKHVEQVSDKIIITSQLEMEFKKNRHGAMIEGMGELKLSQALARPGLFSDAKEVRAIRSSQKKADARVKKLKARYIKALTSPAENDPVYKICQRIFHKQDSLVVTRDMQVRRVIRRRAFRRFVLGYPPRKRNDTSMGDAFNWEWMLECATSHNAELVIVSRDADYGTLFENKWYPNDHLLQEFRERVSRKRKLLLYGKLSEALEHFQIKVTESEKQVEAEVIAEASQSASLPASEGLPGMLGLGAEWTQMLQKAAAAMQTPEYHQYAQAAALRHKALREAVLARQGRTAADNPPDK